MHILAEAFPVPWESLTLGAVMTAFAAMLLKNWISQTAENTRALKAVAATSTTTMQLLLETRFRHHARSSDDSEDCKKCCDKLDNCLVQIEELRRILETIYVK